MLINRHHHPRQCVAEARFVQLPAALPDGDRVVLGYRTLALNGEDPVQVRTARAPEGGPFLFRR